VGIGVPAGGGGKCIVDVVIPLDDVGLSTKLSLHNVFPKSKNKRVWFSGACVLTQMKFIKIEEPFSQYIKFAVKVYDAACQPF